MLIAPPDSLPLPQRDNAYEKLGPAFKEHTPMRQPSVPKEKKPAKEEDWYVKLPGEVTLRVRSICMITEKVVILGEYQAEYTEEQCAKDRAGLDGYRASHVITHRSYMGPMRAHRIKETYALKDVELIEYIGPSLPVKES